MTRLTQLRQVAEYVYLTFPIRRLLLFALIVLSAIPGTFFSVFYSLPSSIRIDYAYIYASMICVVGFCMYGAYKGSVAMGVASLVFGRKYMPHRYRSPSVRKLARKMGITKKVEVYTTSNPWVKGPYTNGFTSKVYIPVSWVNRFPSKEILATIGHELGHVKTGRRFGLEMAGIVAFVATSSFALGLHTVPIIAEVFEFAQLMLLMTWLSWRNERRADLLSAAAMGPEGLIAVFEQLRAESKRDDGSETHPPLKDRIARLSKLLDGEELTDT